jgi:hypothetical protein
MGEGNIPLVYQLAAAFTPAESEWSSPMALALLLSAAVEH